jgi:FkbM family methyltransferase
MSMPFWLKNLLRPAVYAYRRGQRRRAFARHGDPSRERALMAAHLPANPVIVEAGAHIGADTWAMSRRWSEGRIHAFEPEPSLYAELRRAVAGCRNVSTYPLALGATNTTLTLHVSTGRGSGSSSLLAPKAHLDIHRDVAFTHAIQVPVVTLDAWATAHGVDHVDALWLDLQGMEHGVLQAAPRVLSTVQVIVTEFARVELYAGQTLWDDLVAWLAGQGFAVVAEFADGPGGNAILVRVAAQS